MVDISLYTVNSKTLIFQRVFYITLSKSYSRVMPFKPSYVQLNLSAVLGINYYLYMVQLLLENARVCYQDLYMVRSFFHPTIFTDFHGFRIIEDCVSEMTHSLYFLIDCSIEI